MIKSHKILLLAVISASTVGCPKGNKRNADVDVDVAADTRKETFVTPEPPKPPAEDKALWERNFNIRMDLAAINFSIFNYYHLVNSGVNAPESAEKESLECLRHLYDVDMPAILNAINDLMNEIEKKVAEKDAQIAELINLCKEKSSCEVDLFVDLTNAQRDLHEALNRIKTVNVSADASVQTQSQAIQDAYTSYQNAQKEFVKALQGKNASTQERIEAQKSLAIARFENAEIGSQLAYANTSLKIYNEILHVLTVVLSGGDVFGTGEKNLPKIPELLKMLNNAGEQRLLTGFNPDPIEYEQKQIEGTPDRPRLMPAKESVAQPKIPVLSPAQS